HSPTPIVGRMREAAPPELMWIMYKVQLHREHERRRGAAKRGLRGSQSYSDAAVRRVAEYFDVAPETVKANLKGATKKIDPDRRRSLERSVALLSQLPLL